jgi:hypothetical protein
MHTMEHKILTRSIIQTNEPKIMENVDWRSCELISV